MSDRDPFRGTIDRAFADAYGVTLGYARTYRKRVAERHTDAIYRAIASIDAYPNSALTYLPYIAIRIPSADVDAIRCALDAALAQHGDRGGQ